MLCIKARQWPIFFLLLFQLLPHCGEATEYQPWLGNFYEFEWRSSLRFQEYAWLSTDARLKKYRSHDVFLNASLSNALPDPEIGAEIEIVQGGTKKQKGGIDQVKITGRYLWLDDVAGDPLSVIFGLSYIQAFQRSLKDVSSFHHGLYNGEVFCSIGKETPLERLWGARWWVVGAIGVAEQGSPWMRIDLNYEKRIKDHHELAAFLRTLWGLGHKRLRLHDFRGYGPIQHQSIDLGLRYTYVIEFYGNASIEYSFRPYAQNFPCYAHQVIAQIMYQFGL